MEGHTLGPLLRHPEAITARPALTTHGRGNHSVRSARWRYIRYADGSEELYDHDRDELEWTNLARDPALASVKQDLARWLPKVDAAVDPVRKRGGKKGKAKPQGAKR